MSRSKNLDLTPTQQSLYDLVNRIPEGRWSSYSDLGEALVDSGDMAATTNRGAMGRGAASSEDTMRIRMASVLEQDHTDPRSDAMRPFGYPWWRVRNDDGYLVHGGIGRERTIETDRFSEGNVLLEAEGGEIVGGGFASQRTRYVFVLPRPASQEPICTACFLRPCQCES